MRIKTIVIIVITILLTIVITQNSKEDFFNFLWATFRISRLIMLLIVAIIAFILGVLVGRPKRVKKLGGDYTDNNSDKSAPGTLSDDDKDYIN
ncbi:hypothetical protein [Mucilaginibacter flavidus]|uniref:hypothetical protein n=1 Tax=Mucilaginibacter flavidus TaxID=2949309 RepID=UPI0020929D09|nr:hypothetical protein [Mucilaginibacter flavidus]MCO5948715.1 hypothetical protein [Mucilaginibacter flavidus]